MPNQNQEQWEKIGKGLGIEDLEALRRRMNEDIAKLKWNLFFYKTFFLGQFINKLTKLKLDNWCTFSFSCCIQLL